MKKSVVHIGTYANSGGAARALYRLHQGLLQLGTDSLVFSKRKEPGTERVKVFRPASDWKSKIQKKLFEYDKNNKLQLYPNRPKDLELFSFDKTHYKRHFLQQLPPARVYNLHWISQFVDIPTFFEHINKPVVWTLHDMNPFTGGCHYDNLCGKFAQGCGACPQLGSENKNDWSAEIFERKRNAIASIPADRFRVVAGSYWLAEEARKSKVFEGKTIEKTHYGLDHNLFKPRNKKSIRKLLEIPDGREVILFGAPEITNKRKGFKELLDAVRILSKKRSDILLLSFGAGNPLGAEVSHIHLGNINNDLILSWVYSAADVFVMPSLQEAFGQTCLEAMACGVACAGFSTGGIPDMIKEGITGHLACTGNTEQLAVAIDKTLNNKHELGLNARKMVEEEYKLSDQAKKYLKIYNALLK